MPIRNFLGCKPCGVSDSIRLKATQAPSIVYALHPVVRTHYWWYTVARQSGSRFLRSRPVKSGRSGLSASLNDPFGSPRSGLFQRGRSSSVCQIFSVTSVSPGGQRPLARSVNGRPSHRDLVYGWLVIAEGPLVDDRTPKFYSEAPSRAPHGCDAFFFPFDSMLL